MGIIGKASEVGGMLMSAEGRRALRSGKPVSIASFRLVNGLRHASGDFGTVIDGGANVGQFARAASTAFPQATIYSIEPLPDAARQLRQNLGDHPQVKVFETCIGERDGTTTIRENAHSQASSILPIRSDKDQGVTDLRELRQLEVPIARLDTLLAGQALKAPVLLKLDLQGYELQALKGAPELLKQCSHLLVETVFETFYEGEPLFEDLLLYLREAGFHFVRPLNFLRNVAGDIIQMDALFARKSH